MTDGFSGFIAGLINENKDASYAIQSRANLTGMFLRSGISEVTNSVR